MEPRRLQRAHDDYRMVKVCEDYFFFVAVDDADTCAGRFCVVEIHKVSII